MRANIDTRPGAKNITGTPAFSAAGQKFKVKSWVRTPVKFKVLNLQQRVRGQDVHEKGSHGEYRKGDHDHRLVA